LAESCRSAFGSSAKEANVRAFLIGTMVMAAVMMAQTQSSRGWGAM